MPNESLRVPLWCPICGSLMKGKSTMTYYQHGACIVCFITFIEDREARWKNGWRPGQDEVQKMLKSLEDST